MHLRPFVVLPFAATLAACPAESPIALPSAATFADASELEREAAVHAAVGSGPALAAVAVFALEQDALASVQTGGCLQVSLLAESPPKVRIEADGCVGASGMEWDGVLVAENASLLVELLEVVDGDVELLEGPMRLDFQHLSMGAAGQALAFHGTVEQTATEWGAPYRSIVDLEADFGPISFASKATWDCAFQDDVSWCDVESGAEGEVPGLGTFEVAGGFTLGGGGVPSSGELILTGTDELRIDLEDLDEEGCAAVLVGDEVVQRVCLGSTEPVDPHPDHEIVGGGLGCNTEAWYLDAIVAGDDVALVRATLYFDDGAGIGTEVHPLPYVAPNDLGAFHQVQVDISGTYASGATSAVACAADDTGVTSSDVLIEAVDAEGEVLACLVAGQGGRVPAAACATGP